LVILIVTLIHVILTVLLDSVAYGFWYGSFSSVFLIDGIVSGLFLIVGYLVLAFWAWLVGTKLSKGTGSFGEVRTALAYAYFPVALVFVLELLPSPWSWIITILAALWSLVIVSSAIRETLRIEKGVTFFIVISAFVVQFLLITVVAASIMGLMLF
jgi:hypothetical protein